MKNKIECYNEMSEYINQVAPLVIEHFSKNQPKFKTDGGLYKKNADAVKQLIDSVEKPNKIQVYVRASEYSHNYITLKVKSSYSVSEFSCNYIDRTIYVWDTGTTPEFVPYKKFSVDMVDDVVIQIKQLKEQREEIESEINKLHNSVYPIIER